MEKHLLDSVIFKYFFNERNLTIAQQELEEAQGEKARIDNQDGFITSKMLEDNASLKLKISKIENEIEFLNSAIIRGKEYITEFLEEAEGKRIEIQGLKGSYYKIYLDANEPVTENRLKIISVPLVNMV
jgi:hypothetical protein